MTHKNRIEKLERTKAANTGPLPVLFLDQDDAGLYHTNANPNAWQLDNQPDIVYTEEQMLELTETHQVIIIRCVEMTQDD